MKEKLLNFKFIVNEEFKFKFFKVRAHQNWSDIVFFNLFFYPISPGKNTHKTRFNFFLDAQFYFYSKTKICSIF